jgi:molybdopterin converting factor small subunit
MNVTVKLGSILRTKAPGFVGGEGRLSLPDGAHVGDVLAALDIAEEEVNLIYRDYRLVTTAASLEEGDRVALFPPIFIHFSQFYLRRDEL